MHTGSPNIIFAIDDSYIGQLACLITSIFMHAAGNSYNFYVLHDNIRDENREILSEHVGKYGSSISYINLAENIDTDSLKKYLDIRKGYNYITKETFFRFYIQNIFTDLDKALYLDADCLLFDNINKLYNENINKYAMGVVQDNWQQYLVERKSISPVSGGYKNYADYYVRRLNKRRYEYFNAGVLLMNLCEMRKGDIAGHLLYAAESSHPYEYQDQDILNSVLEGRVKYLDARWNILKDLKLLHRFYKDKNARHMARKALVRPGIVHFAGSDKPWIKSRGLRAYEYVRAWWHCYRLTPFYKPDDERIYRQIMASRYSPACWLTHVLRLANYSSIKSVYGAMRNVWRGFAA